MALKDFTWFDKKPQYSPRGMEDYVSKDNKDMGYQSGMQGGLSLLGKALSGVGAAFAGDSQWLQRQTKMDQEMMQADLEFKAALQKQVLDRSTKAEDRNLSRLQTMAYMKSAGLDPAQYGLGDGLQTQSMVDQPPMSLQTAEQKSPTLADAFPVGKQKLITKQGLSSSGKPFFSQTVDPEYQKSLELRNNQIKEFEDFANPLEKLATRLDVLDKAIDEIPDSRDFKPGFGSKLLTQGSNALADFNNETWYRNYDMALNKSFLPASQAEGMSKVMSDLDLTTQIKSLGDPSIPKSLKKQATQQIRDSLGTFANSKIKAFGIDKEKLGKIYPEANRVFLGGKSSKKESGANESGYLQTKSGIKYKVN